MAREEACICSPDELEAETMGVLFTRRDEAHSPEL